MVAPAPSEPVGIASLAIPLQEKLALSNRVSARYVLDVDTAVTVNLTGLAEVHFVLVKVSAGAGRVRVRLTSADGSAQSVPVDGFLLLFCRNTPVTALDLTRTAGVETTVELLLGETTP